MVNGKAWFLEWDSLWSSTGSLTTHGQLIGESLVNDWSVCSEWLGSNIKAIGGGICKIRVDDCSGLILQNIWETIITWGFPKMELPKNGWFMIRNPLEMDWGSPYCGKPSFIIVHEVESPQTPIITARVSTKWDLPCSWVQRIVAFMQTRMGYQWGYGGLIWFDDIEATIRRLNGDIYGKLSLVNQ